MKKILSICLTALVIGAYGQSDNVGIGTTNPDNSAILDLSSSNKGFLLPRMTKDQRLNIQNPAQGLQVFQTNEDSGLYVFNGTEWTSSANSVAAATDPWLRGGNSISSGEFIGTTNSQSLVFKVNNINSGQIAVSGGNTYFGQYSGNSNISGSGTGTLNTGIGNSALLSNSNGRSNLGIGANALRLNNTGNFNVAIGVDALRNNQTSYYNIAIGANALKNSIGAGTVGDNTAIGGNALSANTTGTSNVGIGPGSLSSNSTGSGNLGFGQSVLSAKTSGDNNIAIGTFAGQNNINGSNNIFLGNQAGRNESGTDKLYISNSSTTTPLIYGNFAAKFVSIGDVDPSKRETANTSGGYNLLVKGGILTEKVKVALASSADWADYVFEDNYKLMPLKEVEAFVKENKHLPNVPSAEQMVAEGLNVSETNKLMMEKIEELTLYVIQLQKEIEALKK